MTKEVTKKESAAVSIPTDLSAWGEVEVFAQDLKIPKAMLSQGLSKNVIEGLAKIGDVVNSLTNEIIGGPKKELKLLPFHIERVFYVSKFVDGGWKFHTIDPVTVQNSTTPYETIVGGVKYKNEYVFNAYCLTEDMSLPIMVSFKGMSKAAGSNLFTLMYADFRKKGLSPAAHWMNILVTVDKNAKGTYATVSATPAELSTVEQQQEALTWLKTIKASKVTVVDEETRLADSEEFTRF